MSYACIIGRPRYLDPGLQLERYCPILTMGVYKFPCRLNFLELLDFPIQTRETFRSDPDTTYVSHQRHGY